MSSKNLISKRTSVSDGVRLEPPVRTYGEVRIKGKCEIGRYTFVNERTTIYRRTKIGRYCSIGKQCEIGTVDHPTGWLSSSPWQYNHAHFPLDTPTKKFVRPQGVAIGHDVWIGSLAIIKSGITIGSGAIIAGGSVVVKDVPPYAIVGGTPAKLIRLRFTPEVVERLLAVKWWDRPMEELVELPFDNIVESLEILEAMAEAESDAEDEAKSLDAATVEPFDGKALEPSVNAEPATANVGI